MKHELSGTRGFGHITVYWLCDPADASCQVKMWWRGALIVEKIMQRQGLEHVCRLPFNVRPEKQTRFVVVGQFLLAFNEKGVYEIAVELNYPEGEINCYRLWPEVPIPPDPIPPSPLPPDSLSAQMEVLTANVEYGVETDLFPYLYMRPWPGTNDVQLCDRFIEYVPLENLFYNALLSLAKEKDRVGMETAAVSYVDRVAPYDGIDQFIGDVDQLPTLLNQLAASYCVLRTPQGIDYARFRREVELLLNMSWATLGKQVNASYFSAQLDRCWHSVFALTIILGDKRSLLDALIKTIVLGHLLMRMFTLQDEVTETETEVEAKINAEVDAEKKDLSDVMTAPIVSLEHGFWTRDRINEGLCATLILPDTLFPLPLVLATVLPPNPMDVVAYAIGDLELVRRRLSGYALGEVSHIENVMKGELLEATCRQLSRVSKKTSERSSSSQSGETLLAGVHSDFLCEAYRSLAASFLITTDTSYGPPTDAMATEKIQVLPNTDKSPQYKSVEKAAQRAQEITSKMATVLARQAEWERATVSLLEHEETVVHRIDGTQNERNVRGIYRWVDKIYKAHVVNYGHRLILEFYIAAPATNFAIEEQNLHGVSLFKPKAPTEFGLNIYTDISIAPDTPSYYATLFAYYGVSEMVLPPQSQKVLSIGFQAGKTPECQDIAIPEGYEATAATISANWNTTSDLSQIFGLVGTLAYSFQTTETPDETAPVKSISLIMQGESGALPFSVALVRKTAVQPGILNYAETLTCMVNLDIVIEPSQSLVQHWQFQAYNAIQLAFAHKQQVYFENSGAIESTSPSRQQFACQYAVKQNLQQQMRQALWERASRTVGAPGLAPINRRRYLQFFEQAFEWNEMAYALSGANGFETNPADLSNQNGLLSAYLQSTSARVLLPVRPEYMFIVPYFLDSGMIWYSENTLTPVNTMSIDMVNELKCCIAKNEHPHSCSKSWEIRVPTAMKAIQDGDELPVFK